MRKSGVYHVLFPEMYKSKVFGWCLISTTSVVKSANRTKMYSHIDSHRTGPNDLIEKTAVRVVDAERDVKDFSLGMTSPSHLNGCIFFGQNCPKFVELKFSD